MTASSVKQDAPSVWVAKVEGLAVASGEDDNF